MNWDNALAVRIFFTLVTISLSAGCSSLAHKNSHQNYADYADISTSGSREVATIGGANSSIMLGLIDNYCWIRSPGLAKRVTVDAGMIDVVVWCEEFDFSGSGGATMDNASFHFEALAGHEYEISTKRNRFRLRDVTVNEVLETCGGSQLRVCGADSNKSPKKYACCSTQSMSQ